LQESSFVANVVEVSPTLMERLKGLNPF